MQQEMAATSHVTLVRVYTQPELKVAFIHRFLILALN